MNDCSLKETYGSERKMLCLCCKEYKSVDFFERIPGKRKRRNVCNECHYFRSNRGRIEEDAKRENNRVYRMEHPHKIWAIASIHSHKSQGMIIGVSVDELEELALNTSNCPICNCHLMWGSRTKIGHPINNSPTWDRKYNGKRLTLQNTWIICFRCNSMKRDMPLPELIEWCRIIVDKFGSPMVGDNR